MTTVQRRLLAIALIAFLAGTACLWLFWRQIQTTQPQPQEDPNYTLFVFDIGQGDALFLEQRDGTQFLIDGGPDDAVLSQLGRVMAPWDRDIDYLVATHPHADHLTGLISVLDRYRVHHIVLTDVPYTSGTNDAFLEAVAREVHEDGAEILDPQMHEQLTDLVRILYPSIEVPLIPVDDVNEASIVLEVDDGVHQTLLMGDAGRPTEDTLLTQHFLKDVDVLKVGHHGSSGSSSRPFLDTVRPEYALISDGVDNDYHHPHPSTLNRLQVIGASIWRTDLHGTIRVRSWNTELLVEAY